MSGTISIRLDYSRVLLGDEAGARAVAEILARPCFAALERVSGRNKDRWSNHTKKSADVIAKYLLDDAFDAVSLDTKREDELAASSEIENTLRGREPVSPATGLRGYVVVPFVPGDLAAVLSGANDLAVALRAAAGFVALEPNYRAAKRLALSSSTPKMREGLSELRQQSRWARHVKNDHIATQIASVEWGTFLGAGHLARIDLAAVRASGVFERVVEVTPELVFLQLTADPLDDIAGGVEAKLPRAREALAPLLMDLSDLPKF